MDMKQKALPTLASRHRLIQVAAVPVFLASLLVTDFLLFAKERKRLSDLTQELCAVIDGRPGLMVDREESISREQLLVPLPTTCQVATGRYPCDKPRNSAFAEGRRDRKSEWNAD